MKNENTKMMLPNSEKAERALLGAILYSAETKNGDWVWDMCQKGRVTAEMFYNPANSMIYQTMLELDSELKPIDYTTLNDRLEGKKVFKNGDSGKVIAGLFDGMPNYNHARDYISIVKGKYFRRVMIERGRKVIAEALNENDYPDTGSVLSSAQSAFLSIDADCRFVEPWKETVDRGIERTVSMLEGKAGKFGLKTGIASIDDTIIGIQPKQMVIIGARPSVGKTSLAMNIVERTAIDQNIPTLVFSLEMDRDSLLERMIASRAELDSWMLRSGMYAEPQNAQLKEEAKKRLEKVREMIASAPLYIEDDVETDIMRIRAKARRYVKNNQIRLIVIDYLTLCRYRKNGATMTPNQEVSEISRVIKGMAKELNVPVIVLSQLSRKASDSTRDEDGTEVPKMSDLRDSGAIEQEADIIMLMNKLPNDKPQVCPTGFLTEEERNDGKVVVHINVAKNRNGMTGEVDLLFDRQHTRFLDRS